MLQFEELRLELLSYEDKLKDLAEALGLQKMKDEVAELEAESAKDGFWDDVQRSQKITQHTASLKNKIKNNKQSKNTTNASSHCKQQSSGTISQEDEVALDIILDKIKKSGYASLTEEEKRRLFQVSKNK